jgi:hypothetical protein
MANNIVIPDGYGIASLVMRLTGRPNPFVITYGFDHTALTATTPDAMAGIIGTAWSTTGRFMHVTNTNNFYTFEKVHILMNRGGAKLEGNAPINLVGTNAGGSPAPPNVSIIVRKRTALAGRQFRGRMFFPPAFMAEASLDQSGVWASAALPGQQTQMNTTFTALNTAQLPMVLLHRQPKAPLTLPNPTVVSSLEIESVCATQRRRLR